MICAIAIVLIAARAPIFTQGCCDGEITGQQVYKPGTAVHREWTER